MSESERVDIVDTDDTVISVATLQQCYENKLLHRAVCVFLWNHLGELCLQKRGLSDDWFPGFWTASCTGHVRSGEDCFAAAKRELEEELGVVANDVNLLFKFVVPLIKYENLTEHEIMYVMECSITDGVKLRVNKLEVEEARFFTIKDFKEFFKTKRSSITPDSIQSFQKFVESKGL